MKKYFIIKFIAFILIFAVTPLSVSANSKSLDKGADGVYSLLVIGVDRRDDKSASNSDVMMLVTVNEEKETIFLTSFLRDLYADIPGVGVRKLNAAYANGGPELCVETITENYQVKIDNYVMVDFEAMIDIVEALDGVEIEITEEEKEYINTHVGEACRKKKEKAGRHQLKESGSVVLDGFQALTYARDRSTGNTYDFGRTERQRKIISAIIAGVKESNLAEMVRMGQKVIKDAEHDLEKFRILNLSLKIPSWIKYDIVEQNIPYDGEYYIENEILIPKDMQATIEKLRQSLY